MGFVPFANCARLEARFIQEGQHVENVYHLRSAAAFTVGDMEAAAAAFVAWFDVSMQPLVASAVTLTEIVVRGLDTPTDVAISYTTGLPLVGGNVSAGLPNNVTAALKWTTALSGRSYRGRTYHIGLTESQVAGSTIDATVRTNIQNTYLNLIGDMDTAGFTMVVASRVTAGAERVAGVATTILSCFLDSTVDSQRRRLPGRGQ